MGIGVLSVVATVVITYIRGKAVKWARKINDPVVEKLNEQLDIWIDDSINTVNKNFVDKLKEVGEWDRVGGVWNRVGERWAVTGGTFDKATYKQNASEALDRCLASLKSRIPKPFKRLVLRYYDDVDLFYKNRIDERLKEWEFTRNEETERLGKEKIEHEVTAKPTEQDACTDVPKVSTNTPQYTDSTVRAYY